VEVEYLRALAEEGFVDLEPGALTYLRGLAEGFGPEEAEEVKSIEAEVGHDVEAIVRFLKSRLRSNGFFRSSVWVHAGLTSEDVNSTAFSLSLKAVNEKVLVPELEGFCAELAEVAWRERATPMLARTHGRPAVPTTLGRELAYHAMRTLEWIERLRGFRMPGKLSGAIGSYAGLREFLGERTLGFVERFLRSLGLEPVLVTKQVLPADRYSIYLHHLASLSMALTDLARDLWLLSMLGYVELRPTRVGSSTMPQKQNPVEAENAEGNLELAANLLSFVANRLQTTRLQRDLSDSTLRRNVAVGIAHLLIGVRQLRRFLGRASFDAKAMEEDLRKHEEVLAEAVQLRFRRYGFDVIDELRSMLSSGLSLRDAVGDLCRKYGLRPDQVMPSDPLEYTGLSVEIAEKVYREVMRRTGLKVGEAGGGGVEGEAA
jgi:adenylosuccinate lyase